jgi:hypothetical protein
MIFLSLSFPSLLPFLLFDHFSLRTRIWPSIWSRIYGGHASTVVTHLRWSRIYDPIVFNQRDEPQHHQSDTQSDTPSDHLSYNLSYLQYCDSPVARYV